LAGQLKGHKIRVEVKAVSTTLKKAHIKQAINKKLVYKFNFCSVNPKSKKDLEL